MNTLKTLISTAGLALATSVPLAALAQNAPQPAHGADIVVAQANTMDLTEGVIRKVDKDTKKLTIKHGDIKNLDMPGMTMVFKVTDPTLLDKVQVGNKVRFVAAKADGALVVTAIEAVK